MAPKKKNKMNHMHCQNLSAPSSRGIVCESRSDLWQSGITPHMGLTAKYKADRNANELFPKIRYDCLRTPPITRCRTSK